MKKKIKRTNKKKKSKDKLVETVSQTSYKHRDYKRSNFDTSRNSNDSEILNIGMKTRKKNGITNYKENTSKESISSLESSISEYEPRSSSNLDDSSFLKTSRRETQKMIGSKPLIHDTQTDGIEKEERGNILDMTTVTVATVKEKKGSKRRWNKTFLCIFCNKTFAKLPRHWYKMHPEQLEIAKIQSLDVKSIERTKLIAKLQNKGTFKKMLQR